MTTKNVFQQISLVSKGVAIALILIGIPTFILDGSPSSEMPLMSGLFILFITREKNEDERSLSIKTSSLYISFLLAYSFKLILTNLHAHQLVSWHLVEINHFIVLVFSLSLIIYYSRLYWVKA